MSFEETVGQLS